jgi:hypothetical protein
MTRRMTRRGQRGGARSSDDRQTRFERVMLSFMGPPQLGDVNAPPVTVPDPRDALCPRCASPWDDHHTVRTSSHTYLTCPDRPAS